ncbi:MAG TPA: hypothetical protein ENG58_02360 [Thermotogales bacterium]|nr:hypothetical protein [Thermotogales bacterium]
MKKINDTYGYPHLNRADMKMHEMKKRFRGGGEVHRSGPCSTDVEEYFEGPIFKDRLPMIREITRG